MKTLFLAMLIIAVLVPLAAMADEHTVNLGIFTEHYESDKAEYNENSRLVQYEYLADSEYTFTAASFENSHYEQGYMVGVGKEWDDTIGAYLAAVYGYEDHLETHYEGIIFVPVLYIDTWVFRHTVMGTAYNLGITVEF